jgi:o-succinylbenzoate synthase
MAIHAVEVRLLCLSLVEPFAAAHGSMDTHRELVVVRVDADEGTGWGECAALPRPGYTSEWAAGAFTALAGDLAPRLIGGPLDPALVVAALGRDAAARPMAAAALEQAVLDATLRAEGRSLARWLGSRRAAVPAGAAVGLAPDTDTLVGRVAALVEAGFGRVKVKVGPGWDVVPLRAVRNAFGDLELQADANGSYDRDGAATVLRALEAVGLTCVEQPLAADDLVGAAGLRRATGVPVALDESAASVAAVDAVLAAGAADVVVVKPARLGGLAAARVVHDRCRDAGVAMAAGGLVEAGLGRRALAAVAALPGFTVVGDCAPAGRWLRDDPWPPEALVDGALTVHRGPGVGPEPDGQALDRVTVRRVVVDRPG